MDQIARVKWGGVSRSVNGIPTGTTYTLAFGDDRSEAVVELRRKEVYSTFLEKLWRAVCARLLAELIAKVRAGGTVSFGEAVVRDNGVTLTKHKWLASNERVDRKWSGVQVWPSREARRI